MKEFAEKKYKRAILIGAGSFFGLPFSIGEEDFVIAIDGGMKHCEKEGIRTNLLLGDFDSYSVRRAKHMFPSSSSQEKQGGEKQYSIFGENCMSGAFLERNKQVSLPTISLPAIKNDTDLHAAVKLSLEMGIKEMHILGALGGERMDHSYAALQSLAFLTEKGGEGYLYGERQVFTALRNGIKCFSREYKGYFSAFSFSDSCSGVSEKGFKYRIENVCLRNTEPVGVSNEFIGEEAEIEVKNGILILSYELLQA